jgi:AcrR family transcriptional regulator
MKPNKNRRTQAQRRKEMKQRLVLAALECLEVYGYHGTSISRIVDKAGVSRGSWIHHYKSKRELIAAAAQWWYDRVLTIYQEAMSIFVRENDLTAAMERVWEGVFQIEYGHTWLEITTAVRTDEELCEIIEPMTQRFNKEFDKIAGDIFGQDHPAIESIHMLWDISDLFLEGVFVDMIWEGDKNYYRKLKQMYFEMASVAWTKLIPK